MLEKLEAVSSRYEELCAKSEQPDFYADPQKAAKLLREKNDLEPIVAAYTAYNRAQQEMDDAEELMSDPEMKELSKREIHCECGYDNDRDVNAALNIRSEGLRILGFA